MAVLSWVTWFFSSWEKKNCLQSWANSQNDKYFHSKRQPRTILSENCCESVNLLNFASSSFCFSLIKITWLNSQQPRTGGHVEHHSCYHHFDVIVSSKVLFPFPRHPYLKTDGTILLILYLLRISRKRIHNFWRNDYIKKLHQVIIATQPIMMAVFVDFCPKGISDKCQFQAKFL